MIKTQYMQGLDILEGKEPDYNGIGHDFEYPDEVTDLWHKVKNMDGDKWIEKCKAMLKPSKDWAYMNRNDFSYVNYVSEAVL